MEQKYDAPLERVLALLTDPKWLETRCLALGELAASAQTRTAGGKVFVTMKRRVRRELPRAVAKVMPPESDLVFEQIWSPEENGGRSGTLVMNVVDRPVRMTAEFALTPSGKGCVYRIKHKCKCSMPLIGGAVERFTLGEVEAGCAREFEYLVEYLKRFQ